MSQGLEVHLYITTGRTGFTVGVYCLHIKVEIPFPVHKQCVGHICSPARTSDSGMLQAEGLGVYLRVLNVENIHLLNVF